MKKVSFFVLLVLSCLLLDQSFADDTFAKDISDVSTVISKINQREVTKLFDRDYTSYIKMNKNFYEIEFSIQAPCYGMYICWADKPSDWQLLTNSSGEWQLKQEYTESDIIHQFYPLDGEQTVKIKLLNFKKESGIAEIYFFTKGTLPSFVQFWDNSISKADIMLLFAHPDDEVLFFGGTIPYYAGELKKEFKAVALTCQNRTRRSELLDSLWTCGLNKYPEFLDISDQFSRTLADGYSKAGKKRVMTRIVEVFRKFKPDVVITHDINGEYGHGQHRLCADAAFKCFDFAASPDYEPGILEPWQVKKLYWHLADENNVQMNWDIPLRIFDGKTGFEIAQDAYQHHKTQHRYEQFKVEPRDSKYSSYSFGLVKTTVGLDIQKNDFLENIEKDD